jgi:flagellar biosynthesis chaperone FliJ
MKNTEITELNSSLKNYNFKGWTSDKIIEKYEYVLASREKQIEDLSLEFGNVYQNLNKYTEMVSNLEKENNDLISHINYF